jgi:chorismate mutase
MTESAPTDRLAELRAEMDEANEVLLTALNARGTIALAIAREKQKRKTPQVRDLPREQRVLDAMTAMNEGPFTGEDVRSVFQAAMDASSRLQAKTYGLPIGDPAAPTA